MKSFSQFLEESYLNEEPAGRPAGRRKPSKSVEQLKAEIDAKEAEKAQRAATRQPSGAAADPSKQFKPQGKTTTVKSPAQPTAPNYRPGAGRSPQPYSGTPSSPSAKVEPVGTRYSQQTGSQPRTRGGALALRPQGGQLKSTAKAADTALTSAGSASKIGKIGKFAGPASAALDTALSTADERAKGSGWARSLAKGATVAAGGLLGGTAGAIGGGGIGSAITGTAGAMAGGAAAEKAFDTVAGANAKERKAMATANRQRQAGTAIKGIGGKTTFDTKKNTMTTGTGSQRKTVGLAKTGVVQRGGQSVAGHLAYKDGKAVYKAGPSAQSLAKTSSNPLERIGRSLFAGAYKKSDAAAAAKKLNIARQSDAARNKALGVKALPGK